MSNYSKLFGAIIGGVIGLAAEAGLDMAWATPELVGSIATLLGAAFGAYIAPANKPVET